MYKMTFILNIKKLAIVSFSQGNKMYYSSAILFKT